MPNGQRTKRTNLVLKGALFLMLGEAMLAIMVALIKHVSETLPNANIVFFRNLFGWLFLLVALSFHLRKSDELALQLNFWQRMVLFLRTDNLYLHLARVTSGLTAMYIFFLVVGKIPLVEASLVKLTSPFFLPIIAFVWLRERIKWLHWLAIIIGFVGVVFIINPQAGSINWYIILGLLAAFLASIAKTSIRRMAISEPILRVVFYFSLFATLVSGVALFSGLSGFNWIMPTRPEWLLLVLIGLCGTLGQLALTHAYQLAKPGQIGPYTYVSVVFATVLGWVFWSEALSFSTIIGCLLIVFAGIVSLKGR